MSKRACMSLLNYEGVDIQGESTMINHPFLQSYVQLNELFTKALCLYFRFAKGYSRG